MPNIELIWVTSGRHPETEALICKATKGRYGHAAVRMEIPGRGDCIVEAVRPAARIVEGTAFDACLVREVMTLSLTETECQEVVRRALAIEGKPYGVDDCITGGLHDLGDRIRPGLGDAVAGAVDKLIDNPDSYNCSGAQTYLVHGARPAYAAGVDLSKITPEGARRMAHAFFPAAEVKVYG